MTAPATCNLLRQMNQTEQYVVYSREGALAEIDAILKRTSARRLFLVLDKSAYSASGAATILEPHFRSRTVTRFSDFELNPKLHDIERGIAQFRNARPDLVIALGRSRFAASPPAAPSRR